MRDGTDLEWKDTIHVVEAVQAANPRGAARAQRERQPFAIAPRTARHEVRKPDIAVSHALQCITHDLSADITLCAVC